MSNSRILLLLLFILMYSDASTQQLKRYKTFSYSVNEGLLQSTIADIEIDKNNFCWVSFPNGIQKFDGQNFDIIPIQPGLPDDKNAIFFKCKNGDLLISHSKGISKYDISRNKFTLVYQNASSVNTVPKFIGEDNGIIYFTILTGTIVELDSRSFKKIAETEIQIDPNLVKSELDLNISSNIIDHRIVFLSQSVLYLWDLHKRKLISKSEGIAGINTFFLRMKTENEINYYMQKSDDFFSYNFLTAVTTQKKFTGLYTTSSIVRSDFFIWHGKNFIFLNNDLYETDNNFPELKTQLVNFQNQPISNSGINLIKEDNYGNLYISTVSNGIKKIINNNYLIKYYGTPQSDKNYALTIFPDKKNNRVFIGSSKGALFIYDSTQQLVKSIAKIPGSDLPMSINQVVRNNQNEYYLFIVNAKFIAKLSPDLKVITKIPITTSTPKEKRRISFFGNYLYQNNHEAVIQSQNSIYRLNLLNDSLKEYNFIPASVNSGLLYHHQIICHANDELIFLDTSHFNVVKKIPFKNTGGVRCFAKGNADEIYLGTNKGIFKIDRSGTILDQYNRNTGLPDECIYTIYQDRNNNLWCSTNKGIIKINTGGSFLQITKEDGLQENEFNTNAMAVAYDGEYFYGGVNGGSSFYPLSIHPEDQKLNLMITNLQVNNREMFRDTAVWKIDEINLPYNQNLLSFNFIAMGNDNPAQYIYQYKMKGIDDGWIINKGLQTVRYFLPPGKYVLQVYASRYFNNNAQPLKEIIITIQPPFWKSWWFISLIVLLCLSIMTYIIDNYNRRSYLNKVRALEAEKNIQIERERISRDLHDNIGGYANAVLYKTELLKNEHDDLSRQHIIKDLRFATKDIITSLRETIWAMKKKDYSAQDCLIRIRNFIQPFVSYYPSVYFKVEGDAPEEKFLSHTTALHVVRIVQEAVTNAIKHSSAKNILVTSIMNNDKWELSVKDDGCGFDVDGAALFQKGNGLGNMKKRAEEAGFFIQFTSNKNRGTCLKIII